jgi:Peptidase M66
MDSPRAFCRWLALILVGAASCSPDAEVAGGIAPATNGSLVISVEGLPNGVAPAIVVSSAQGYQHNLAGSDSLGNLPGGSYAIVAPEVISEGDRYAATAAAQSVTVVAGASVSAQVVYVLVTARLQISVSGVPNGASAALSLRGPGGFSHVLAGSELLTGLLPGSYQLEVPGFELNGDQYEALPEVRDIVLPAPSVDPVSAVVDYELATGRLVVAVQGLPSGTAATLHITGPGFDQVLTHGDTLAGLSPGSYSVAAGNVSTGGFTYVPAAASVMVAVAAVPDPATVQVNYGLATGALQIEATGIPVGASPTISVTGPGGFHQNTTGSALLTDLSPGSYSVDAGNVNSAGDIYLPTPSLQTVSVTASLVPAVAGVQYQLATATLVVEISGLPAGVAANVTVVGPGGSVAALATSQTLSGLSPGTYAVSAAAVSGGGFGYAAQPPTQNVTLGGGESGSAKVSYAVATGNLSISVAGLPGGVDAGIMVGGPAGYSHPVAGSEQLSGLAPGAYSVTAAVLASGGITYSPVPASQGVGVSAGNTAAATVSFSASSAVGLDLRIDGAYLTQATQRYDGSVPLVAGRDAYLRVFAVANQANTAQPQVRVRLYDGAALVQTYTLGPAAASVPTAAAESDLNSSWNVLVPGALVQPGLQLLAEVDPGGVISESDEANNQFPVSGTPASVDIRALATFSLRFVPVLQPVNGLQGNITAANQNTFLGDVKKLLPVAATDVDIRAPYTTTAPALQGSNANLAWNTILNELVALRAADASARYYYGVVKVGYSSGVAGLGYVGGSAHTAMGWDYLPSGVNIMAHEVGHNLGRQHAPCGNPSGPDPAYPYPGGQIGVWGFDVTSLALKAPTLTDVMSYCSPNWISDYNWSAMIAYRQSGPNNAPAPGSVGAGLLVWGRITPGGIVLEPAFQVPVANVALPRPGANRLDLLAADGSALQQIPFEASEVADLPGGTERHFAFVLPLNGQVQQGLAALRVVAGGRSATRSATAPPGADPALQLSRPGPGQLEVRWDAGRFPMVLVRDAATGQILSFARGGVARLWAGGSAFQLQFSDGVRGVSRAERVLR